LPGFTFQQFGIVKAEVNPKNIVSASFNGSIEYIEAASS
jgi:hypothetical protein